MKKTQTIEKYLQAKQELLSYFPGNPCNINEKIIDLTKRRWMIEEEMNGSICIIYSHFDSADFDSYPKCFLHNLDSNWILKSNDNKYILAIQIIDKAIKEAYLLKLETLEEKINDTLRSAINTDSTFMNETSESKL